MLVNLNYVLDWAEKHKCAIGAFNTPTSDNMRAVIGAAEKYNVPVIIMHAEVHDPQANIEIIGPLMKLLAEQAKVPVCLHLDHCLHMDFLKKALDIGFTSVMFDASTCTYEENVELVKETIRLARPLGVSVEAEIGIMGGREAEGQVLTKEQMYTDPELAKKFIEETGIDALACSFGTAHGIYKEKPQLDFDRIRKIKELTNKPIVMHGGSGLSDEDYVKSVDAGVRKINAYSYISRAGVKAVQEICATNPSYYLDIANYAKEAMQKEIEHIIRVIYKLHL